jgi:hypothetical protein
MIILSAKFESFFPIIGNLTKNVLADITNIADYTF